MPRLGTRDFFSLQNFHLPIYETRRFLSSSRETLAKLTDAKVRSRTKRYFDSIVDIFEVMLWCIRPARV